MRHACPTTHATPRRRGARALLVGALSLSLLATGTSSLATGIDEPVDLATPTTASVVDAASATTPEVETPVTAQDIGAAEGEVEAPASVTALQATQDGAPAVAARVERVLADPSAPETAGPEPREAVQLSALAPEVAEAAVAPTVSISGLPAVCDTNLRTGKVDTFMQRSDDTSFANGQLAQGLYEGGYVHQRVELTNLRPGENELVFTYDVRKSGKWAYDYLGNHYLTHSTITTWTVVEGTGPDRVDTVFVTFDVPAGRTTDTLYFSAHIASELDHGPGSGAGSINGSPYHVTLKELNCAQTGGRDNQISAAAVQAGHVTVTKVADPADGTDFTFALSSADDDVSFVLDDGADADAYGSSVTYRVAPGSWTVDETDLPPGWNLADLSCDDAAVTYAATTATFTIDDDDVVVCTFVNAQRRYADLQVTMTVTPTYALDYDWTIEKLVEGTDRQEVPAGEDATFTYDVTVTPESPTFDGFAVTGIITVTNPNTVDFPGVAIFDTLPGGSCAVSGAAAPVTIPAGASMDYYYACDLAGAAPSTSGTNKVEVTWSAQDFLGTTGAATAETDYDFAEAEVFTTDATVVVTDSVDVEHNGTRVDATDGPATFTYEVTWPSVAGECETYDNTATIKSPVIARVAAGASLGVDASSTETVMVCAGVPLTVDKTVAVAHTRTYDWSIDKNGDATEIDVDENGTATVGYTVDVAPAGFTDSGWAMSGTIVVTNPNLWQDVTADVTDAPGVGGGGVCTVDGGADAVVPAGESVVLEYDCTFAAEPALTGTNAATVTWDADEHATAHGAAGAIVPVAEGDWVVTDVNDSVTVMDDKTDPTTAVRLGTVTLADGPRRLTYELTHAGVRGTCDVQYANRAWIVETGQADTSTVTVCWHTPGIDVVKHAWDAPTGPVPDGTAELPYGSELIGGHTLTWTYVVTNTGTSPLDDIEVTDTFTTTDAGTGQVPVTCPSTSLAAGASMTCTGSGPVGTGTYGLRAERP